MTFLGWVAVLAGWYVTEIGRQPWIVSGVLKVQDVVADHSSATVGGTLLGYILLYGFLLASYIGALLNLSRKPAASLSLTAVSAPKLQTRRPEQWNIGCQSFTWASWASLC